MELGKFDKLEDDMIEKVNIRDRNIFHMQFKGSRCITFIEDSGEHSKGSILVYNNRENFDKRDLKNPLDINLKRRHTSGDLTTIF